MKRMNWKLYDICWDNDGRWHSYVLVQNIDHTGRRTGGEHWHGLSMVGYHTKRDARTVCRQHWNGCDGDVDGDYSGRRTGGLGMAR